MVYLLFSFNFMFQKTTRFDYSFKFLAFLAKKMCEDLRFLLKVYTISNGFKLSI